MEFGAEFFIAIAFVIFVGGVIALGGHRQMTKALDARIALVEAELGEVARLRSEATALLASFAKKRVEAQAEAESIVALAKFEAETLSKEAAARTADFVARRTKQAAEKIAQAEAQATAEVRAAAAEAATRAAEIVLKENVKGTAADQLVAKGIDEIKRLMH